MNDVLRIACLKIALQRAFLGRAILRVILLVTDAIWEFAETFHKNHRALIIIYNDMTYIYIMIMIEHLGRGDVQEPS